MATISRKTRTATTVACATSWPITSVVHAPPGRGSCKILNGDLTRIIIEYERADQIPDCLITCSGCTGSIRLEHHRAPRPEESTEAVSGQVTALLPLLSDVVFAACSQGL